MLKESPGDRTLRLIRLKPTLVDFAVTISLGNPESGIPPFSETFGQIGYVCRVESLEIKVVSKGLDSSATARYRVYLPMFTTLQLLKDRSSPLCELPHGTFSPEELDTEALKLVRSALERPYFDHEPSNLFHDYENKRNGHAPPAGLLLLQGLFIISYQKGRPKKNILYFYERSIIVARKKGPNLIVLHEIPHTALLLVNFLHPSHKSTNYGISVYWSSFPAMGDYEVFEIDIFSEELDKIMLWAGFLAMYTPTCSAFQQAGTVFLLNEVIRC